MSWLTFFSRKRKHKHDWVLSFPFKDQPLNWVFTCSGCGESRDSMPSVEEML